MRVPASPKLECALGCFDDTLQAAGRRAAYALAFAALTLLYLGIGLSAHAHVGTSGSGIIVKHLSHVQIDNLATLGKVWGFLKYHDPAATSGKLDWDRELFHVMPEILAAPDRAGANAVLLRWIDGLGPVAQCKPCAHLSKKNLEYGPNLGWLSDTSLLGPALSRKLLRIYRNRTPDQQYYDENGTAPFEHERTYPPGDFPNSGLQLLALFRFWNIIEYWYPDRNTVGENWNGVLKEFVPRLALARTFDDYQRQLMQLIAEIHDSHANLWSSEALYPPTGSCHLPVLLGFVQGEPVVTRLFNGETPGEKQLQLGDVITRLDGRPVSQDIEDWMPYYGGSNRAARLRYLAAFMTRGKCGPATVDIRRAGKSMTLSVTRGPWGEHRFLVDTDDALPGPGFRLLTPGLAYINSARFSANELPAALRELAGIAGLIVDLRDEDEMGTLRKLAEHLVARPTPFVLWAGIDAPNPGAVHFYPPPASITPRLPHYAGKLVVLVNSHTQSSTEWYAMMYQAAGATIVGSTTAGADGPAVRVPLPGELHTLVSGAGPFYPDGRPAQHLGVIINRVERPTVAQIRAGIDPALDEAIRLIVGPKVPLAKIEKMYRRWLKSSAAKR